MRPTFAGNPADTFLLSPARRNRRARRRLLAALAITLHGCGGGNAFTGGSVPIGKAALKGRVVRSEDASLPLYNALITIVAAPQNSNATILHTMTDHNGNFSVTGIPTDAVNGAVTVTATPAENAFKAQQVSFQLSNNHSATVVFALPPAAYTPAVGTTLTIVPSSFAALAGQRVSFTALLRGPDGAPLPLTPTLFVDDSYGALNSDGTFTGTSAGTSSITAYWYNGLKSSAVVSVTGQQVVPRNGP